MHSGMDSESFQGCGWLGRCCTSFVNNCSQAIRNSGSNVADLHCMVAATLLPQAAGGVEMDVAADGSKVKVGTSGCHPAVLTCKPCRGTWRAKFAIIQLCRAPSCSRCCRLLETPPPPDLPRLPSFRQVLGIPTNTSRPAPAHRYHATSRSIQSLHPPFPFCCLLQVLVIPTDEELSIAQQTLDVIRQSKGVAAAA